MNKIYAEVGFGNESFLSTEMENGSKEYRVKKLLIPKKILGVYFRFWILKRVFVISTVNGLSLTKKDRNKFKILFGIEGTK